MSLYFNHAHYFKSATELTHLPEDSGCEVAFAGRSNAGKSSAINTITGVTRLARTSKTPGRTQMINCFILHSESLRLMDLPGYGYAKVPEAMKLRWKNLLDEYFQVRQSLKGLMLMMDIRHPLKPQDKQMLEWAVANRLPVHILLTKADKFKRSKQSQVFLEVKKALSGMEDFVSVQLFSSHTGQGVDEARIKLELWLVGSRIPSNNP